MPVSCSLFRRLVVAVLVSVGLLSHAAAEQPPRTKVVEVIGSGDIRGQDSATARERAISDGLVLAVHGVVADLIALNTQVQNFQTLNETLYEHTDQFVQNYKVLTEAVSNNTYRVMLQATVLVDMLVHRLSEVGVTQLKRPMPSILFLIAEQKFEDTSPEYWWGWNSSRYIAFSELAMAEKMKEKGFSIIDYETMLKNSNEAFSNYSHDLKDTEAINMGTYLKADVVVVGKAVTQKVPNMMGEDIGSSQGMVTVYALSTETSEKIASTVQTFVAMNSDEIIGSKEALAGAGFLAGKELASQITAVWLKQSNVPQKVKLIVDGTRNLGNFVAFKRILNDLPGVKNMQTSEVKANEATIIVNFDGSAEKLAETLMLKTFDSFGIKIYETSEDRILMELFPR